jgi:hypothetical protein
LLLQVRALSVLSDDQLLSASRDASAKHWQRDINSNDWHETKHFADGHGKFISAVSNLTHQNQGEYGQAD